MGTKKTKPKKAKLKPVSKRKSKVFSVSMSPEELDLIDCRVDAICRKTGLKFSRNEYMRKAALATDAYFASIAKVKHEDGEHFVPDFSELFINIG